MWKLFCCVVVVFSLALLGQLDTKVARAADPNGPNDPETESSKPIIIPLFIPPVTGPNVQEMLEGRTFVFSEVPKKIIVPVVTNMAQSSAEDILRDLGFTAISKDYIFSDTHMPGDVISQTPSSPAQVESDTAVNLVIAQTEIAVQPYECRRDVMAGQPAWGQLIVHRQFDVQLEEGIQHIPMFAILYEGLHHAKRGEGKGALEARAKCIAERLSIAWDFMDQGGYLAVAPDEWIRPDDGELWRLSGPYSPEYGGKALSGQHAIYVRHPNLGSNPLRIMTVYPEDAERFGAPDGVFENGQRAFKPFDTKELAEYLVALVKAHHLLFSLRSDQIADYEKLEICKTREGRIFKEIYLRSTEAAAGKPDTTEVQDALARIAMDQRYRLERLADTPPRDWRFRSH